jgi:hypothetical protein
MTWKTVMYSLFLIDGEMAGIMRKLTKYRYAKKVYFAFVTIGLLLLIIAQSPFTKLVQFIIMLLGALFILGAFIWVFIFYKCPFCHDSLPFSQDLPEYCPSCSEKLSSPL